MVIDTSALVAILQGEPEAAGFIQAIAQAEHRYLSAANLLEAAIVLGSRFGPEGEADLDRFIAEAEIRLHPVTAEQAAIAREAFRNYGKGRHPAALNFGDCFAYALAKQVGDPLLFKGDDFSRTDLISVL